MVKLRKMGAGVLFSAIMVTALVFAGTDQDARVKKDLLTVITLQSQPCGEVLSFQRQGEHDYLVTCQTGDRYHVHLVAEGRVKVEKQ